MLSSRSGSSYQPGGGSAGDGYWATSASVCTNPGRSMPFVVRTGADTARAAGRIVVMLSLALGSLLMSPPAAHGQIFGTTTTTTTSSTSTTFLPTSSTSSSS